MGDPEGFRQQVAHGVRKTGAGHIDGKAAVNGGTIEFFSGIIVKLLATVFRHITEDRQQQTNAFYSIYTGNMVCRPAEKAFRTMGQGIHHGAAGHHRGQRLRIAGVAQGQNRVNSFVVKALFASIRCGNDGHLCNLTARTGSGTHRYVLKGRIRPIEGIQLGLGKAGIGRQNRNALGSVQSRAAADSQNKVRACPNGLFRRGHAVRQLGVLANFIEQKPGLAVLLQGIGHILQSAAGFGRCFAGYDQTSLSQLGKLFRALAHTARTGDQFHRHKRIQRHLRPSFSLS